MLKIGYFADGPWSHNAFRKLIADENIKIEFICVRYDTEDLILKDFSDAYKIPYLKHSNINHKSFLEKVSAFDCDLFVSMSFNQIFRTEVINLPRFKVINCHAGKLPFYRGRNILNWALINDENEFGITVHFVDEGIDTGDIILQRVFPILDTDDYSTLLEKAYVECADILYDAVKLFLDSNVVRIPQREIHPIGFYCSQRKPGDEILNWNQTSREIFNFVRAMTKPGPMALAYINGKECFVNKVDYIKDAPIYKGIVGAILYKDLSGIYVKTMDSFIKIIDCEFEGSFKVGDRFEIK